jgi:hypothetical protein
MVDYQLRQTPWAFSSPASSDLQCHSYSILKSAGKKQRLEKVSASSKGGS